jgi:hypothetical protein
MIGKEFNVTISRTSRKEKTFLLRAQDPEDAEHRAHMEAIDLDWNTVASEKDAEYNTEIIVPANSKGEPFCGWETFEKSPCRTAYDEAIKGIVRTYQLITTAGTSISFVSREVEEKFIEFVAGLPNAVRLRMLQLGVVVSNENVVALKKINNNIGRFFEFGQFSDEEMKKDTFVVCRKGARVKPVPSAYLSELEKSGNRLVIPDRFIMLTDPLWPGWWKKDENPRPYSDNDFPTTDE